MMNFALIVLASGLSRRFNSGNKLLANLQGRAICERSAKLGDTLPETHKIAVVPNNNHQIAQFYQNQNWQTVANTAPQAGLSEAIKLGLKKAMPLQVDYAIFTLADMPFINDEHIQRIMVKASTYEAIMSSSHGVLMPPAGFRASLFRELIKLQGDKGAKSVFLKTENRATIDLTTEEAVDIDTIEDLTAHNLKARCHA